MQNANVLGWGDGEWYKLVYKLVSIKYWLFSQGVLQNNAYKLRENEDSEQLKSHECKTDSSLRKILAPHRPKQHGRNII